MRIWPYDISRKIYMLLQATTRPHQATIGMAKFNKMANERKGDIDTADKSLTEE